MQKRKVLNLEWKSEGVGLIDDESGESLELMEEVPLASVKSTLLPRDAMHPRY